MAASKHTIIAIDGVIKEVIEKANGGITVKPGDSECIANAILTYYNNKGLAVEHGINAKKFVSEHFEREKISQDFENILKQIIFS